MGVRFLIESSKRELSALDLPATRLVLDTPQYRIIEDLRAWPRVFLATGALVATPGVSDPTSALEARALPQFPSLTVNAPPETINALNARSTGPNITPVTRTVFNRNSVLVTASTQNPALLVLTDVSYPGWRVWVNGQEKPILTVQGLVRGVALPSGNHQIEFRYQPDWLWWGLSAAALGWLAILTGLSAELLLLRKNSSQNHPASD
jgi:hypothetical protein